MPSKLCLNLIIKKIKKKVRDKHFVKPCSSSFISNSILLKERMLFSNERCWQ